MTQQLPKLMSLRPQTCNQIDHRSETIDFMYWCIGSSLFLFTCMK